MLSVIHGLPTQTPPNPLVSSLQASFYGSAFLYFTRNRFLSDLCNCFLTCYRLCCNELKAQRPEQSISPSLTAQQQQCGHTAQIWCLPACGHPTVHSWQHKRGQNTQHSDTGLCLRAPSPPGLVLQTAEQQQNQHSNPSSFAHCTESQQQISARCFLPRSN